MNFVRFAAARGAAGSVRPAGHFKEDEAYPDTVFGQLADAVGGALSLDKDLLLRQFGEYLGKEAFPRLAPEFYEHNASLFSALLQVEEQIHETVRAAIHGAAPPHLRASRLGDIGVVIAYTSERRLCALLEGLVAGTAERYGETVAISQPQCMLRGDTACSIVVEAA